MRKIIEGMSGMSKIDEIKERSSNIGGTPWKPSDYSTDYYLQGYSVKTWNDAVVAMCIEEKGEVEFIGNAPSDIKYLLSLIEVAEKALDAIEDQCNNPHDVKIAREALQQLRK